MTSESSEFVAAPLRTSSVPQLLNYTLLEASKDLVDQTEWTTQTNQINTFQSRDLGSASDAEDSATKLQTNTGLSASSTGPQASEGSRSGQPNMLLVHPYPPHTTLGGSVANSGGGNAPFADLVSTSYGLALNDYTDDSRDGGVATSAASAANHAQNVLASHCGGNSEFSHHQEPYCENLDTFHAEFITQPIDYPIDATPPPPLSLSQAPPTLNLQNTVTTSSTPSLSPSGLPSFLDTYSPGQDRQERFFKQEPAATPPTPTFNAHPPSSSSYASHGYNQQQGFAFPKKEETFSPTMSDFYQPNSFAQFPPNFSADTGGRGSIFDHQEEVTPSALTHALQGVVQGHSRILAKRTQYSAPCTETSGSSKSAQARMGPPAVPPPIRATPGSGSGSSKSSGRSTNAAKQPAALLCAVCGDNAACQHYGVRTCEGCKGFFKRTVQKNAKYVCLSNKDCPVDKRRRNRCQFCRFQKCLNVGMVKEVVRTDSLKGRRGRLPSKPRSPHDSPPSPPQTLISVLVRAHNDTTPDLHNLDYSQLVDWSSQDSKEGVINRRDEGVLLILNLIANSLETCRRFCDRIPGMADLIANDREILTKSAIFELLILKLAHLNKGSNENFIFCNGSVVTLDQVRYILGDWVDTILSLSHALYDMDIDLYAFACLCALTLVNDRPGLTDPRKVESLTNKVINSLKEHTTYHPQAKNKQNYFARTVEKLQTVQVLRQEGRQKLFYLILELRNMGHPVHIPPIVEEIASQVH